MRHSYVVIASSLLLPLTACWDREDEDCAKDDWECWEELKAEKEAWDDKKAWDDKEEWVDEEWVDEEWVEPEPLAQCFEIAYQCLDLGVTEATCMGMLDECVGIHNPGGTTKAP